MKSFLSISISLVFVMMTFLSAQAQGPKKSLEIFQQVAQERGLNVNTTLAKWEKDLVPILNSRFPNLAVSSVSISRSTGEISVKGRDGNGTMQTLPGVDASSGGGNSSNMLNSLFDWWYDVEGRKNNIGPNSPKNRHSIKRKNSDLKNILDNM
ncbi:MAG: hypothetical protein AAF587_11550 [Bacteroidota bacterium]